MRTFLPSKYFSLSLLIGGIFGLAASATLTIEKIFLLEDPNYKLSCSLNEILACGSIVTTEQASIFGFANSIIGVIAFPVLITIGLVGIAGFVVPKYFLHGLLLGLSVAHIFVLWLIYQSLYVIGALCPWCMVVWAVVVPLNLLILAEYKQGLKHYFSLAILGTIGWFLIVLALIAARFFI